MSIRAAEIYKDILTMKNISEQAQESYVRNLRKKMNFLVEKVALRKVSDFKEGNNILMPNSDAAIVRNLLMSSLDDEYPLIVDWFNGSLDLSDSEICLLLYWSVKEPIMRAEMTGESDMVTVDEWLATIKGLLNVDMAENTIALKNKLEEFRVKTLVRDSTVSCGDIVIGHENGFRDYASHYEKKKKTLSDELLKSIVKDLSFQEDYYHVLEQIIDFMIEDAKDKAIPAIECYALAKGVSDCETAIEMIRDPENITMVSEYYPWLKKIGAFLKDNPEETKRIEEYAQVKNLEKFFE